MAVPEGAEPQEDQQDTDTAPEEAADTEEAAEADA